MTEVTPDLDRQRERTPADELRTAAKTLRETHAAMVAHEDIRGPLLLSEWAEWFGPEDMVNLPVVNSWIRRMSPALAEPLAAWLEGQATRHDEIDCIWCGPNDVPNPIGPCAEMADALAVARAITGSAS